MRGLRIGLVSDTHGVLRPEALDAMRGCDRIIHAGDIGAESVLRALRELAPLHAIRGNIDREPWARALPDDLELDFDGCRIMVLHDARQLQSSAMPDTADVVVCGHSHRPTIVQRDGVLFINPGSAGPRRFKLPVSVGYLHVEGGRARGELRTLA